MSQMYYSSIYVDTIIHMIFNGKGILILTHIIGATKENL